MRSSFRLDAIGRRTPEACLKTQRQAQCNSGQGTNLRKNMRVVRVIWDLGIVEERRESSVS